jgi:formate dehydrogenase subunit delta
MLSADLVRMSTQIAQFFEPYPEAEAVADVREHLMMSWDPSMRAELLAIRRIGEPALHPLVAAAADQILSEQSP